MSKYTKDEIILALAMCLEALHQTMNDLRLCGDPECTICELIKTAKESLGREAA